MPPEASWGEGVERTFAEMLQLIHLDSGTTRRSTVRVSEVAGRPHIVNVETDVKLDEVGPWLLRFVNSGYRWVRPFVSESPDDMTPCRSCADELVFLRIVGRCNHVVRTSRTVEDEVVDLELHFSEPLESDLVYSFEGRRPPPRVTNGCVASGGPDLGPYEGRVDAKGSQTVRLEVPPLDSCYEQTWLTLDAPGFAGRFSIDISCEQAPATFRVAGTVMSPPAQALDRARELAPVDWSLSDCNCGASGGLLALLGMLALRRRR